MKTNLLKPLSKPFTISILSALALLAMKPLAMQGAGFTMGNLAVEQLVTNATSSGILIEEINPNISNAAPVNTITIPITGTSALRQSSAGTDGRLALTQDRTLLAFSGAKDGTGTNDETSILPRGVGTVNANGTYVLQASYTGTSGNQARSATSLDNKTWYFGDKGGIYTNGTTSALNAQNVLPLKCFGGAVYVLSAKSPALAVSTLSLDGKTLTGLPGLAVDANAVDFYMVASGTNGSTNDILYVNEGSKVVKFSLVSSSWVNNGTNTLGVTADGLCAISFSGGAYLYVTTGTGGSIVKITDAAGYNTAPSVTPANNKVIYSGAPYLKGIDFAPVPNLATEQLAQNTTSSTFSIVELDPGASNATPANIIGIPSTTGGTALRQSSAGSTGRLALTGDRTLLAFTGAQDSVGTNDETKILLRGVGTIDASVGGNYTLQTTYTGISANQTRSATSLDNKTWYCGDKGGIYTNGTTTPVNSTNIRPVRCFGGQVIACAASSSSATPSVLSTVSADATTLTPLPGLETAVDANAVDFYMIASGVNGSTYDIAYVNDGITVSKYSLVSGSWTSNGAAALGVTADGICAANLGGEANLYVTTGTNGTVVQVTDTTGYNAAPVITPANNLVLYSGGLYLKGIDFAPVVSSGVVAATPPTLTAAVGATVDGSFTVTFTDDPVWRGVITNITVNSVTLTNTAYVISSGHITFTPAASTLLQTAGALSVVVGATGYNLDLVSQPIAAGVATHVALSAQPAAPSASGGTLTAQPLLVVADQYGNAAANTSTFTATASAGWTLGGSAAQVAVSGTATFTNLSATVNGLTAVSNAQITFTASGTGSSGLSPNPITSSNFVISAPPTTFTPGNLAVFQEDVASKNSTFSIIELSPSAPQGSPVNVFPVSATGSNAMRMTSAATTGRLAISADATLICFAAFMDGTSLTADEATIDPRGVGTFNAAGNFTLQTTYVGLGDATGNQARSATSLDNMTWYIGDKGGVYTNNDTSPAIGGTGSNVRSLKCFGGTVYALQQFSANLARNVLSTVVLTPTSQQLDDLAGLPEDASVLDFYMVQSGAMGTNYDTIYYIDGTNATSGAIFKYYTTDGMNWVSAGSVTNSNGGDGLCVATNPAIGGFDLYYTTGSGGQAGNSLIKVHDSAANNTTVSLGTPVTLYTVAAQATLKGLDFAPLATVAAPTATTSPATQVTAGSATLNATVNPNGASTAYWFLYGTNTSYGSSTATNILAAGLSSVSVSNSITGLLQGKGYHFQVVASNTAATVPGADSSFTTLSVVPTTLTGTTLGGSNTFQFSFTNATGASFSVLTATNITTRLTNWTVVGQPVESPAGSGHYKFTGTAPTNAQQYYILRQP